MVSVSDGIITTPVNASWNVVVNNVNRSPVISAQSPSTPTFSLALNATQNFSVTASDPEGTALKYTWKVDGLLVAGNLATFSTTFVTIGTHTVRAEVFDGQATTVYTWTVSVN